MALPQSVTERTTPERFVLVAWPRRCGNALWASPEFDTHTQAEEWLRSLVDLLESLQLAGAISSMCTIQVESNLVTPSVHGLLRWTGTFSYIASEGWEVMGLPPDE